MRIAIYHTNPIAKDAALRGHHYGRMFEDMLHSHMSGAVFEHFDVVDGVFPDDPTIFDAVVITGSSAFVTDKAAWIETLFSHILEMDRAKTKLFAVCFGHQAVAMALGGVVDYRDVVIGAPQLNVLRSFDWMQPAAADIRLFSGNFQQVVALPESLELIGSSEVCPFAMMVKGDHILTLQFHPELTANYMLSYINAMKTEISKERADTARSEVAKGADGAVFARWAAAFMSR